MKLEQRTIGIIGAKRTGKTYFTAKLCNQLINEGKKLIVFDTIGELGKQIQGIKLYHVEPEKIEEQGIFFGSLIREYKGKKPIGVNLVDLTRDEIIDFTDAVLISAGKVTNKYFVFDEVAEYLNQQYRQSRELERLIRHGGNWNNTFIFNTQRPAYLNKNTFNLIDILIVFRLNWNRDLSVVKELLTNTGMNDKEIREVIKMISNQRVGEYRAFQLYIS